MTHTLLQPPKRLFVLQAVFAACMIVFLLIVNTRFADKDFVLTGRAMSGDAHSVGPAKETAKAQAKTSKKAVEAKKVERKEEKFIKVDTIIRAVKKPLMKRITTRPARLHGGPTKQTR